MAISPGTRFGPYEIVAPLGSGGMGEVYLARDTRLGREVAVKVLRHAMTGAPELRARFEREARTISSLNHPNICSLFDVGRAPGEGGSEEVDYLVMERVEGETLATRLGRGPLPTAELLKIGAQIADALDRAHRAGIVHRDLKPGNVMLARSGAKLMDFGLARMDVAAPGGPVTPGSLTQSPTLAQPLTAEGTLVGTFQYMAPEQLEGREADARSDVWSLGCVLYEMATGRRAFDGRSQASLISSIMSSEPLPIAPSGPGESWGAIDRVIRQCLAKDPEDRWQSAGDLKRELEWIRTQGSGSALERPAAPAAHRRSHVALIAWAVIATVALALSLLASRFGGRPADEEAVLTLVPPKGMLLSDEPSDVAISPDGRRIAFASVDSAGRNHLWIRDLADPNPRPVAESETGCNPFWSPDGKWLAFFTTRGRSDGEHAQLKKVRAEGGTPIRICDVDWDRGGSWGKNGDILFVPGAQSPVSRISANGGPITAATVLDTSRHETSHRFPSFLPDGDHFVFAALPRGPDGWPICVGSLRSKQVKVIGASSRATTYAAPGYLIFDRDRKLVARRLDLHRLELVGDPIPLTEAPPASNTDAARVATVSEGGRLAVLDREATLQHLEWFDRAGHSLGRAPVPSDSWYWVSLSPDGRRAALSKVVSLTDSRVLIADLQRGTMTPISTQANNNPGAWSPDGKFVAIMSSRSGTEDIYVAASDGSGDRLLPTVSGQFKNANAWSPDGRTLVFWAMRPGTGFDIFSIDPSGGKPRVLVSAPGEQSYPIISPDGRWLAYQSVETGMRQIYVCALADGHGRVQVTTSGGVLPHWTKDGREILYLGLDSRTVYAIPVGGSGEILPGEPRVLFRLPSPQVATPSVDYSPALDRFLMLRPDAPSYAPRITLISDWPARIRKQ